MAQQHPPVARAWGARVAPWGRVPTHLKCGSTSQAVPSVGEAHRSRALTSGLLALRGFLGGGPRGPRARAAWAAGPAGSCLKREPGWDEGEEAIAVSEISGCGTSCRGVGGYRRRLVHS